MGGKGRVGWPAGWVTVPTSGIDMISTLPPGVPELFDSDGLVGVRVRMFITGSGWVDITDKVRTPTNSLRWRTGRPEGQRRPIAGSMTFQLNNHDGWASPRNPLSPYYGRLGRNTPVRLELAGQVVWSGEIATLPLNWDTTGQDRWVTLTASGIRRRLGQWVKPARSPLYRVLTRTPDVSEYWPLDDKAGSTQAASGLIGHAPLTGTGQYGQVSGFPSNTNAYVETLSGTGYYTPAPSTTFLRGNTNGSWAVDVWFRATSNDPTADAYANVLAWRTTAQLYSWSVSVIRSSLVPPTVNLIALSGGYLGSESGSGAIANGETLVDPFDGQWHMIRSTAVQNSATSRTMAVWLDGVLINETEHTNPPYGLNGNDAGKIVKIQAGGYESDTVGLVENVASVGIGEVTMWDSASPSLTAAEVYAIGRGYTGETAGRRCQRLCAEEGIPFAMYGDPDDTHQVGPQTTLPVLTLLDVAADSDMSSLVEQTTDLGLAFQTRSGRYNPDGFTFSWNDQLISPPFAPTDDDTFVVNDVTTINQSGSTGRYEKTSGALNVNNPGSSDPDAVGRYDAAARANLYNEALLQLHAGWIGHEGTWDEARWPQLVFELHRDQFRNDPTATAAVLALRPGSFLRITDPPAGLPPDDIELTVVAVAGDVSNRQVTITLTCVPAGVLRVGRYDVDRYSPDYAATLVDMDSDDTTAYVGTTGPRWAVSGDLGYSVPYDVRIGGERVQVDAVTFPVTDSFTRSVSGSWGTADTGGDWSHSSQTPANFSTTGTVGQFSIATLTSDYLSWVDVAGDDHEVWSLVSFPSLPASGSLRAGVVLRLVSTTNFYHAEMRTTSSGAVTLDIRGRIGGSPLSYGTANLPTTYTAGTWWVVRGRIDGSTMVMKAYPVAGPVPVGWQVTVTNRDLLTGTGVGVFGRNDSAATLTVQYDDVKVTNPQTFAVTRSINGIVKAHPAGERIELFTPARYAF